MWLHLKEKVKTLDILAPFVLTPKSRNHLASDVSFLIA